MMTRPTRGLERLVLLFLLSGSPLAAFMAGRHIESRASAGSIEGAPLRPGTVTVLTFSRLKDFRSSIDPGRTFDLNARSHPFETYPGVHEPRVYHAEWKGWTGKEWRTYSADFEVNGATYVVPLWRADGQARIVYVADHLSERRYWDDVDAAPNTKRPREGRMERKTP